MDLEKAFDREPKEVIWWTLRSRVVEEWLMKGVMIMYVNARTIVKVFVHQGSAMRGCICVQCMWESRCWRGYQHTGKHGSGKWCVSRQTWKVLLSGGRKVLRAVRDLDKEGCVIEVKRESVCDMREECIGVWKWNVGHECRADRWFEHTWENCNGCAVYPRSKVAEGEKGDWTSD